MHIHEPVTHENFERLIASRIAGAEVPSDELRLTAEGSQLAVRQAGAFITECSLGLPVLYRPPEDSLTTAKLPASHVMSPVGPYNGLGGQHGFMRWIDYEQQALDDLGAASMLTLVGITPPGHPEVRRHFTLTATKLATWTQLTNPKSASEPLHTSIGEHLYFAHSGEDPEGLLLNGQPISKFAGEDAIEAIMNGKARFVPGFSGAVLIQLSSGKRLNLTSHVLVSPTVKGRNPMANAGLLLWHLKGSDSICIEPVFGTSGQGTEQVRTDLLSLRAGATALMSTSITVERRSLPF